MKKLNYKAAGVDIAAADDFLNSAKEYIGRTYNSGVLSGIGHFGAFYQVDFSEYSEPVLVSSTDGVGTKLKVAQMVGVHDTIGQDLLNHCVNDILCAGAKPLYFMDYLAMGKMDKETALEIIKGLCLAAEENGVAVIGGETAEMPGIYQEGDYDLAGTIVGIVEKTKIINGENIISGDALVGLPSNGLHTNGYSLARRVCFEIRRMGISQYVEELGRSIGEELLRIHRSYLKPIRELWSKINIKGMAHITGGGIMGNLGRIIPADLKIGVDWEAWEIPVIYRLLAEWGGGIDIEEMRKTFNLGIGMIIVVSAEDVNYTLDILKASGEKPIVMGSIN